MTTKVKTSSFIKIGKIKKPHGIKGELLLALDSGELPRPFPQFIYLQSSSVSLKNKNISKKNLKYFEISKIKLNSKGAVVHLKNCQSRNEAMNFVGMQAYLESQYFQSPSGDSLYLCELLGFDLYLIDKKNKQQHIGIVDHFISHSHQDLLIIQKNDKRKFEIPFVADYVKNIHFEKKMLILNLPENFPGVDETF